MRYSGTETQRYYGTVNQERLNVVLREITVVATFNPGWAGSQSARWRNVFMAQLRIWKAWTPEMLSRQCLTTMEAYGNCKQTRKLEIGEGRSGWVDVYPKKCQEQEREMWLKRSLPERLDREKLRSTSGHLVPHVLSKVYDHGILRYMTCYGKICTRH